MSKVNVSYYGLIQRVSGNQEEVYLSGETTVRELLHLLVERHGNEFRASLLTSDWRLQPMARVFIDGRDINEVDSLNTKLKDNSELSITVLPLVAIAGG